MAFGEECDSKRIERVSLYSPKLSALSSSSGKRPIKGFHFIFILAYV
eukprot:CAMPEP_0195514898 /NCGR_PEP_ID=MMETSP0794_2-20130614/6150_1 /TAXON_ID=515487 /ORGANISM="Stephanopyxis turris, Strain CCMP 815" /LENGTH=46 /DNA_ID= /DNA_START= /DNA_END= /DNA_ORIENTATION=